MSRIGGMQSSKLKRVISVMVHHLLLLRRTLANTHFFRTIIQSLVLPSNGFARLTVTTGGWVRRVCADAQASPQTLRSLTTYRCRRTSSRANMFLDGDGGITHGLIQDHLRLSLSLSPSFSVVSVVAAAAAAAAALRGESVF